MIKKIKNKLKSEDNKRLLSNFISLSILQGVNYILPLLTFPYLVKTLGVENFGILAFATSTIMFFQVLTDFGFNLSATKEVSIHRKNVTKLNEIYSSIMTIKFILIFISFFSLLLLINFVGKFEVNKLIFIYTFGIVVGNSLFPIWFFQGMEKMKYITYLNIIAKGFFTICIFIFIKQKNDFYLVPILNSMGFIIVGLISQYIVHREFKIQFQLVSLQVINKYLLDGYHIFISTIFIHIYSSVSILLLGFFTNNYYVGVYSIIEKIVAIFNGLFAPVTQTLYPYIVNKIGKSRDEAIIFLKTVLKYYVIFSTSLSVFISLFAYQLLYLISKDAVIAMQYQHYLQIMSLGIILSRVGEVFGTFTLVGFGYNKEFSKVMLKGAAISIVISLLLIQKYELLGAVSAYIAANMAILFLLKNKSKKLYLS